MQDRVDRVAAGDREERVAVGRRLDRGLCAQIAAGARLVIDDHRLAQPRRKLFGDETAGEVRAAARRERRHELDRARGPGVGEGRPDKARCYEASCGRTREKRPATHHAAAGQGMRISCSGTCCWAACISVSPMQPWGRGRGRVIFTAFTSSKKPKVMMFWVGTL